MPWIESHTSVERNPKVVAAAMALGVPPVHMSGHLHALWHAALEHQEDGDLSSWAAGMISYQAMWTGDAEEFVAALRDSRLLDDDGKIHNWLNYAGRYVGLKYKSKPEQADAIFAKYGKTRTHARVKSELSQSGVGAESDLCLPTGPDRTLPDPTLPDQDPETDAPVSKWSAKKRPDGLPDEITNRDWEDFVDMRRKKRAPLTKRAAELVVLNLRKLELEYQSPRDCILQSVERGWTGVFPVKDGDLRPQGIKAREAAEKLLGVES